MNWIVFKLKNKNGRIIFFHFCFYLTLSIYFIAIESCTESTATFQSKIKFIKDRLVNVPLDSVHAISSKRIIEIDGESMIIYMDRSSSIIHLKSLTGGSKNSVITSTSKSNSSYSCWAAPQQGIYLTSLLMIDSTQCLIGAEYQHNNLVQICKDTAVSIPINLKDKSISTTYSPIQYSGNQILVPIRGGENFYSFSAAIIRDLGTPNQQTSFFHPYPDTTLLRDPYLSPTSSVLAFNNLYTSFAFEDSIHVTNLQSNEFSKINAASKEPLKFQVNENFEPITNRVEHIQKIEYYSHLIHDPYRKLFYRVAVVSSDTILDDLQSTWFHKPWKLLIFNSDFQKLKEIDFSGFDNCYREVLVSREGLYLGKNFIEDFTFHFDTLKFDLYEISTN